MDCEARILNMAHATLNPNKMLLVFKCIFFCYWRRKLQYAITSRDAYGSTKVSF